MGSKKEKLQVSEKKGHNETNAVQEQPAVIQRVHILQIEPDPNQPRKYFDMAALGDLIGSVKKDGILQNLLLRPIEGKTVTVNEQELPAYMIVFGERRWKAATLGGLTGVPAEIRVLSDREALELQLIENSQREGVQPMEEAVAYERLRTESGYSVEEIAARVHKNPSYVAQRLKLIDLIIPFQNLLAADKLKLVDAYRLSRLTEYAQNEIFKSLNVPKDWQKKKNWELSSVDQYLRAQECPLDSAPFRTGDKDLYPEAGACNVCPHNSHFNKTLFPEMNKKRICNNSVCYAIKCQKSYQQKIQSAMQQPDVLFITTDYYLNDKEKQKVKAAEEIGAVVLDYTLFQVVRKPEAPAPWEEYLKDNEEWRDDEELTDEEKEEALQECKAEWEQENKQYLRRTEEYNELKADGRIRSAFVVAGHQQEGAFVEVILKPGKATEQAITGCGSGELMVLETELDGVRKREARNLELDNEKIFKKLAPAMKEEKKYIENPEALGRKELDCLVLHFYESGAHATTKEWFRMQLGYSEKYPSTFEVFEALRLLENPAILFQFIRRVILDVMINLSGAVDFNLIGDAAAIYQLGAEYMPDQLATFTAEQKEKADKRKVNVDKRIAGIEEKITKLKVAKSSIPESEPGEEPEQEAEESKALTAA